MNFFDGSRDFFAFVVRAIGLVLLLFGLWLALEVLNEAWQLYHEPQRIERFAEAVEKGSNIDRSIAPLQLNNTGTGTADPSETTSGTLNHYDHSTENASTGTTQSLSDPRYRLRLSYYIAWVIALLLLLLLARIALGVVRTGGELVLYETQMKRFARELVRETIREESGRR